MKLESKCKVLYLRINQMRKARIANKKYKLAYSKYFHTLNPGYNTKI